MKNTILKISTTLLMVLTLTACGSSEDAGRGGPPMTVNEDGTSTFDTTNLLNTLAALPIEALSANESASLAFMREEEKLAYDVYSQLNTLWGGQVRVFGNIARSEASHTEAVRQLLIRYGLADPAVNLQAGVYADANLQTLYTNLVTQGSVSMVAALQVGAAIEEIDLVDIETALQSIDNQDIRMVYDNLAKGSRNHLRSFVKNLEQQGVVYAPQHLSVTAYNAIVTTPTER
jgi:hypothetical protein